MSEKKKLAGHDPIAHVEKAIAEIRSGRMVILVDDEKRENEGDLCIAAEAVTPEVVNFMATHGRGLICLALMSTDTERGRHLRAATSAPHRIMKIAATGRPCAKSQIAAGPQTRTAPTSGRTPAIAINAPQRNAPGMPTITKASPPRTPCARDVTMLPKKTALLTARNSRKNAIEYRSGRGTR